MKLRKLTISILVVMGLSTSLFSNGLSLNSLGPKALGMGGANVGLADNLTAIYWNPAGLIGQKTSISAFFTGIMPMGTYKFDLANIDAEMVSNLYPTGGLFANYAMDNMAFGLGIFVPAGLGAEWDVEDFGAPAGSDLELLSQIGAISISPAFAYQVNESFSFGIAVNILYAMFDMKQFISGADAGLGLYQFEEESSGLGFGATLGMLYAFNEQWTAGLTVRLASKVAMSGEAKNPMFPDLPNMAPVIMPGPGQSDFDRDVTWPLWIGGGFAYKPNDKLTVLFDAQYSQWSELDKLVASYDEAYWDAVMSGSGDDEFKLDWEDAVQIRIGGQYMVTPETAIRLGYYYDPAPAPDETLNVLFPSSTNHVGTVGFGHAFDGFRVDAAMEYLIGAERDVDAYPDLLAPENQPGKHQLDIFAFSIGFGMEL